MVDSMKQGCPNLNCKFYQRNDFVQKDGRFYRSDDRHFVQRFKCKICNKKFSYSTHTLEYRQKKRTINTIIKNELASGLSQRRCARNLNIDKKTVARKLIYLAKKARLNQASFLKSIQNGIIKEVQFDDLITSIHTKLKPVSISVIIDSKNRLILGARVSEIPAFGKIAKISRRKYGQRENHHRKNLDELFKSISSKIDPNAKFKTDEHQFYPILLKKYFPHCSHQRFKSMRASVAGLGELKSKKYDPLFMINHTLAMFRANINRLFRKTWCTSKSEELLQYHVDIFVDYFNQMRLESLK